MKQSQTITVYTPKRGRAPRKHGVSMNKLIKMKYQEYKANAGSNNKQTISEVVDSVSQKNS